MKALKYSILLLLSVNFYHELGGRLYWVVVAAFTSGRNKGTDSGGAAGIFWIRIE